MNAPLHVKVLGEGKTPLILLHGWGRDLETLYPLGRLLAKFRQVHLLDLPGFGMSSRGNRDWGVEDFGEAVLAYCKECQIEQFDLLGHSLGGRISLFLGGAYPNKIRKLVLISSAGIPAKKSWAGQARLFAIRQLAKLTKTYDDRLKTRYFETWFTPRFGSADYKNAGEMRGSLVKVLGKNLEKEARQIQAPALLLWGEEDQETPLEMGQRLHAMMRNSTLLTFPGKGHHPYEGVGYHLLTRYIEPFLERGSK